MFFFLDKNSISEYVKFILIILVVLFVYLPHK